MAIINLGPIWTNKRAIGSHFLAIWQSCKRLVYAAAARHAKILEDPASCPALPHDDHVDFRAHFVLAHPDIILVDCREPHKLFVERISRDVFVHGSVPFYKIDEMGLRSDTIVQGTRVDPTAVYRVKSSKFDQNVAQSVLQKNFWIASTGSSWRWNTWPSASSLSRMVRSRTFRSSRRSGGRPRFVPPVLG